MKWHLFLWQVVLPIEELIVVSLHWMSHQTLEAFFDLATLTLLIWSRPGLFILIVKSLLGHS